MDLLRALAGGPMLPFGSMGAPVGGALGGIDPSQPFKATYRCYPVVMANKPGLEAGDKILLPASALDQLARRSVTYPMSFNIKPKKAASGRAGAAAAAGGSPTRVLETHCGVQEFSADEGTCFIPYWMMQNLLLESGGLLEVTNVALKKGSYVKFRPHSERFMQLYNPRVVLEKALRNFSCLTQGDNIAIQHGEENFYLEVKELKPAPAVSIIETDVNVDFDMPPSAAKPASSSSAASGNSAAAAASSANVNFSSAVANHATTAAPASTRDFTQGGWGSSGTAEEEAAAAAAAAKAAGASASGTSSDYFAKLGGGNKLASKRGGRASGSSSASSSAQPSPTLGPAASPSPSPSPSPMVRPASALSTPIRPQSALASRPGGYSLSGSKSPAPAAASSSSSSSASALSASARPASALGSSASSSSLGVGGATSTTTVVERQGNFNYHYAVDAAGHKRLIRRLPLTEKEKAALAGGGGAAASSASSAAPAGLGLAAAGPGHRLK